MIMIYKTLIFIIIYTINSCGIYSFEGSTLHPDIKKIQVNYFIDQSNENPILTNIIEDKIKTIFLEKSKLELSMTGDLIIDGEINDYIITPISINSNETAALNRLNIKIKIKCENIINPNNSFEKIFNRYLDYDSSKDLNTHDSKFAEENSINDSSLTLEEMIVLKIVEQLCEDVYYKITSNW